MCLKLRRKLEHFLVREHGAVHAHVMAPDLAVPALADAAVHVGFEGRVNVRGLHAELHEVAGDGLDAAGGGADDRRGVFPVEAEAGQIVSKTLAQNDAVSITLFAFSKGEEISTHASGGDAMVLVLEGRGRFTIDGREHFCSAGESIVMPAGKPHAVYAAKDFKMLLTVVFPQN